MAIILIVWKKLYYSLEIATSTSWNNRQSNVRVVVYIQTKSLLTEQQHQIDLSTYIRYLIFKQFVSHIVHLTANIFSIRRESFSVYLVHTFKTTKHFSIHCCMLFIFYGCVVSSGFDEAYKECLYTS